MSDNEFTTKKKEGRCRSVFRICRVDAVEFEPSVKAISEMKRTDFAVIKKEGGTRILTDITDEHGSKTFYFCSLNQSLFQKPGFSKKPGFFSPNSTHKTQKCEEVKGEFRNSILLYVSK